MKSRKHYEDGLSELGDLLVSEGMEKEAYALAGAGAGALLGGGAGYLSGEGSLYNRRHRIALGVGLGGLGGMALGRRFGGVSNDLRTGSDLARSSLDEAEAAKRHLAEADAVIENLPLSDFMKKRIRKAAEEAYARGARAPEGGYRPSKVNLADVEVPEHVKRKVEESLGHDPLLYNLFGI